MTNVPEIRFKGFTGAWEQRKLGDVSNIVASGDADKSKLLESGHYPVISNALTNDGIIGYYNDDFRIEAPAVTVTGRGDVGHAQARKTNITPVVRLLAVKSDFDVEFLSNAINMFDIFIESTGVPQLTSPQLGDYGITYPTKAEQTHIGDFFRTLDDTIALYKRKLDALRKLKIAYLQVMFPQAGEIVPKVRFSGFTEPWGEVVLGDVVDRVTRKNEKLDSTLPLTISAQLGLIDKNEFLISKLPVEMLAGIILLKMESLLIIKAIPTDTHGVRLSDWIDIDYAKRNIFRPIFS